MPSDINAAYLWAQLEKATEINANRLSTWNNYYRNLKPLEDKGIIELPKIPIGCVHNAHMFYLKCNSLEIRQKYIKYMKNKEIVCAFHYVPLHSAPAGIKFGRFYGEDEYTTVESDRLVRLPMYYNISEGDIKVVLDRTIEFFMANYAQVEY